jgi:hypothetical protein
LVCIFVTSSPCRRNLLLYAFGFSGRLALVTPVDCRPIRLELFPIKLPLFGMLAFANGVAFQRATIDWTGFFSQLICFSLFISTYFCHLPINSQTFMKEQ